jgi:hypothetical protein
MTSFMGHRLVALEVAEIPSSDPKGYAVWAILENQGAPRALCSRDNIPACRMVVEGIYHALELNADIDITFEQTVPVDRTIAMIEKDVVPFVIHDDGWEGTPSVYASYLNK